MPFSIIGSTQDVSTYDGRNVKGRQYLWGVAEGTILTLLLLRTNVDLLDRSNLHLSIC